MIYRIVQILGIVNKPSYPMAKKVFNSTQSGIIDYAR